MRLLILATIVLAAVLLAAATPGHANIGETVTQLRQRYGSAKEMGSQLLFEVRIKDGQIVPARGSADVQNHFTVNVYFDGAQSGMEVFTRNTSDPVKANMTQADIDAILAATNGGLAWVPIQVANGKPTWVRTDKKLVARFSPNKTGNADDASVLVIMLYTEK